MASGPVPQFSPPPYSNRQRKSATGTAVSAQFDSEAFKAALRSRKQKPIDVLERERLVLPHLPKPASKPTPIRTFLKTLFYKFVLFTIYLLYGIYLRIRWTVHTILNRAFSVLYYHHRTPELIRKDVSELKTKGILPQHLSVILDYERGDMDKLIDEVAEIACWCAASDIPRLSVYERTGVLKTCIPTAHRQIAEQLRLYFGRSRPTLRVDAPHSRSFANGDVPANDSDCDVDLSVMFISEEDGRESLVDLTKTLCEIAQRGKLSAEDVSVDLIDAEVKDNVMDEPDLLILFSPNVILKGYPPWQLRLTEIFNVQDNEGVGYQVFLRALYRFAKTEFRFGR